MDCSAMENITVDPVSAVGGDAGFMFKQIQCMQLFPGMVLTQVDFLTTVNAFSQVRINKPLVEFSFHISGRGKGSLSNGLRTYGEVFVAPATTIVSYNPEAECGIQINGGERFRALNVYLPPHLLGDLLGEELGIVPEKLKTVASGGTALPFNFAGTLDPAMKMIADQIMNCPHQGAIKKIYLESKALELVACRLAQFKSGQRRQSKSQSLGAKDITKIHEAKDRLLARIDNPPSLSSLAREVGTNTTKLSEGFRRVFGTTAYNLLRKERIIRARHTLEEGRMNVTETAHHLGYSDSSHFIREFVRYFGTTPGAYLKTCR